MHVNWMWLAVTLAAAVALLAVVIAVVRAGDRINVVSTEDAD